MDARTTFVATLVCAALVLGTGVATAQYSPLDGPPPAGNATGNATDCPDNQTADRNRTGNATGNATGNTSGNVTNSSITPERTYGRVNTSGEGKRTLAPGNGSFNGSNLSAGGRARANASEDCPPLDTPLPLLLTAIAIGAAVGLAARRRR